MSSPNPNPTPPSQIPTQFRPISRNNSNTSTASSSNKGDVSSNISISNSVASSRTQYSRQLTDHRQLFATCGTSTPIRSFQRATISSVVKTRAFDNNPVLQGLLAATPSGQNSLSNSQTPSPQSTPVFSRSRSLRMSGTPQRYQQSPSHYRNSSRTPELYSFNSGDMSNFSTESQVRLTELTNEKHELKESLEFLECERQVLLDSSQDLKNTLQKERHQWKKDLDDTKRQMTDLIAAKIKAETHLTQNQVEMNNLRLQMSELEKKLEMSRNEYKEQIAINQELKRMLTEKLKLNGSMTQPINDTNNQQVSDCISIVTEMAKLRVEINEKDRILESYHYRQLNNSAGDTIQNEIDNLNNFLDQTVECIKGWPEELAGSSHVQNLMKTLLNAYRIDQHQELTLKLENIHL